MNTAAAEVAERADPDDALVARARNGDAQALDTLIGRHHRAAYEVAYRVLGDRELAEDATQDAFMRALRALPGFRGDSSFRTWILRIAANTATSVGRRRTSRREVPIDAQDERSGGVDPARQAVARDEMERVERALDSLPEKQRLAVTLRLYHDLSHREIAEVIDSSEGAARVSYHLGINRLRELLS